MRSVCLFCDNPAGSREHLWPSWVHRRKKFGPIRHQIGERPEKILPDPEQKLATVCKECNNGWMSDLENENVPTLGAMFADVAIPLDDNAQTRLAHWTLKTSMVVDSVQGRGAINRFYQREECVNMRLRRSIPERTRIWIGRSALQSLAAVGTHVGIFTPEIPARTPAMVVNIVIGHLAIQIMSLHVHQDLSQYTIPDPEPKPGDWDNMLTQIWPIRRASVMWPPSSTFTNGGHRSVATLMDRWRIGANVPLSEIRRGANRS